MRISIRRCLSMLRNTRNGNELALPAINAFKEHSIGCWYTVMCLVLGSCVLNAVSVAVLSRHSH